MNTPSIAARLRAARRCVDHISRRMEAYDSLDEVPDKLQGDFAAACRELDHAQVAKEANTTR